MKKSILFLALALCVRLQAIGVYWEDFGSYALNSSVSVNPPNYVLLGVACDIQVKSGLGGQCAQQVSVGGWYSMIYNGASYTYTDVSATCNAALGALGIVARGNTTDYSGLPGTAYFLFLSLPNTLYLYKDVGTVLTALGSTSWTPANANNFNLRLVCNGTSLTGYGDGVSLLTATDSDIASGKIGAITLGAGNQITKFYVDDGVTPSPTFTPAITPTWTPTASPTITQTWTYSPTLTASPTKTWSPSPTFTASPTLTRSPTPTFTWSPSPSNTPTYTATRTWTQTSTPTNTPLATPTSTFVCVKYGELTPQVGNYPSSNITIFKKVTAAGASYSTAEICVNVSSGTGYLIVCLYSDNNGQPYHMLDKPKRQAVTSSGWNCVPISYVNLGAQDYWLSISSRAPVIYKVLKNGTDIAVQGEQRDLSAQQAFMQLGIDTSLFGIWCQ